MRHTDRGRRHKASRAVAAAMLMLAAGGVACRGARPDALPATTPAPGTVIEDALHSGGRAPATVVVPAGRVRAGEDVDGSRVRGWLTRFNASVARPIAAARTETTVGSFRRFVKATGTHVDPGCWFHTPEQDWVFAASADWSSPPGFTQTDDHPVTCVGYEDARAYAAWLTSETGHRYRVPTEIELEFLIRGDSTGPYSFTIDDSSDLCGKANGADESTRFEYAYHCKDGYEFTAPVGQFPPNGFGLYDTTGNVWEVTSNCWHSDYARAALHLVGYGTLLPASDACYTHHVIRGGSFISSAANLRIAKRDIEGYRSTRVGFRVVRDLD